MDSARAVVVGGGIGGLVVARELAAAGLRVTLIESSDQFGGQVARHRVGGIDLDAGAEAFATRTDAVATLCAELGIADLIVSPAPEPAWLFSATGAAHPLPVTSLLGIPASPRARDVVDIVGVSVAARAALDALLPASVGARSTTLGELVRRRMGDGMVDRLVAPVVSGVYSTHPDDLALARVAPGLLAALRRTGSLAGAVSSLRHGAVAGSAVAGLRGGMAALIDALVADLKRLGVDLRLGTTVTDVRPEGVRVAGVGPTGTAATGERITGIVVDAAAGLLAPVTRRTVTLVTLVVEKRELDAAPRGSGVLVAPGAPVSARALTHQTAKWPWLAEAARGKHVVRLSYAGPDLSAPDSARDFVPPREHIVELARREAGMLLGVELQPSDVTDSAIVQWSRAQTADPHGIVPQVGEAVAGTGLAAVVAQARNQAAAILSSLALPRPQGARKKT